jgi:hypothetical protein
MSGDVRGVEKERLKDKVAPELSQLSTRPWRGLRNIYQALEF